MNSIAIAENAINRNVGRLNLPVWVKFIVIVVLAMGSAGSAFGTEFRNTPFGPFPAECVREHPNGTTIEEIEEGVQATHPDGTVKIHPRNQTCVDFFNDWRKKNQTSKANIPPAAKTVDANYMAPAKIQITKYTANYTVPLSPVKNDDQFVAYWIGLQDLESNTTVLQPVLVYSGATQQWSAVSVHCCPGYYQQQGPTISGIQPGDTVSTTIELIETNYWKITMKWKDKISTLKTKTTPGKIFNWALALLEPRENIKECDELPAGPMTFSDIKMQTANGSLTPDWQILNPGSCSTVVNTTDTKVVIYTNKK